MRVSSLSSYKAPSRSKPLPRKYRLHTGALDTALPYNQLLRQREQPPQVDLQVVRIEDESELN